MLELLKGMAVFTLFLIPAIIVGYLLFLGWGWLLTHILPGGGMTDGWNRLMEEKKQKDD